MSDLTLMLRLTADGSGVVQVVRQTTGELKKLDDAAEAAGRGNQRTAQSLRQGRARVARKDQSEHGSSGSGTSVMQCDAAVGGKRALVVCTAPAQVQLVACPRPFGVERIERTVTAGATLAEMLELAGIGDLSARHAHVAIDGWVIPSENWHRIRPKPGRVVTVRVVARLGTGGSGGRGKNPLRIILSLAVVAASFVLGPMIGSALVGAFGSAPILGVAAGTVWNAVGSAFVALPGMAVINVMAAP